MKKNSTKQKIESAEELNDYLSGTIITKNNDR